MVLITQRLKRGLEVSALIVSRSKNPVTAQNAHLHILEIFCCVLRSTAVGLLRFSGGPQPTGSTPEVTLQPGGFKSFGGFICRSCYSYD